jgi:hypothetical protein
MKYSCIQDKNYNFTVDYRDNHLIYTDHSSWLSGSDLSVVYTLKVYNGETFREFKVLPKMSVIIPYTDLPTNCGTNTNCNFDGVYKFQASTCSDSQLFERTEAILKSVHSVYKELLKQTITCDGDMSDVIEIWSLMEGVKAFAIDQNESQALELYGLLIKIIKKLNCTTCNEWNLSML